MSLGADAGIGLAAVAAVAAAVSAVAAARGVALAHRPYIYGERADATGGSIGVRLFNDGPGTAVQVRWRVCAPLAEPTSWSDPIHAMQPGEAVPPSSTRPPPTSLPVGVDGPAVGWFIETEFGDIRGARWRISNDRAARDPSPRRLRSRWFQLWRSR